MPAAADGPRRGGLIATSLAQASIAPELPRIRISLAHRHHTCELVKASGVFAAHLLTEDRLDLVWRFALEHGHTTDKLAGLKLRTSPRTGSPLLADALGWLDCQIEVTLDAGDRLVFLGFQRDVAAVLSTLDVVVFPSLWEGTPLTVFETLAMGKPIVATDADGLLDVLTDRKNALIVPRRDPAALAAAVGTLIDQPALAASLTAVARETGTHYDIQAFVNKMERLYVLLHETSRASRRRSIVQADLSFLAS